jgi:hypothetical protein
VVHITLLSVPMYDRITGKDLEGSGHSLIDLLSTHLPGVTDENNGKPSMKDNRSPS